MQAVLAEVADSMSDGGSAVGGAARSGADVQSRADGWAQVVLASQRVVNAASAVQAVGLAGIAARDEVRAGDGSWVAVDRGAGFVGSSRR